VAIEGGRCWVSLVAFVSRLRRAHKVRTEFVALRKWKLVVREGHRSLGPSKVSYVALGRLDGYYERGIRAWDIAAGSLILEEAGGKATDYRGGELNLEGREIVASNRRLHSAMTRLTGENVRGW